MRCNGSYYTHEAVSSVRQLCLVVPFVAVYDLMTLASWEEVILHGTSIC